MAKYLATKGCPAHVVWVEFSRRGVVLPDDWVIQGHPTFLRKVSCDSNVTPTLAAQALTKACAELRAAGFSPDDYEILVSVPEHLDPHALNVPPATEVFAPAAIVLGPPPK